MEVAQQSRDEYGFTLVNFKSLIIPISDQFFAFPKHVEQVLFSKDQRKEVGR
jgi:hypothetical protein